MGSGGSGLFRRALCPRKRDSVQLLSVLGLLHALNKRKALKYSFEEIICLSLSVVVTLNEDYFNRDNARYFQCNDSKTNLRFKWI